MGDRDGGGNMGSISTSRMATAPEEQPELQIASDVIDGERAHALAGLLGLSTEWTTGDRLPLMWQPIYFLPRPAQQDLGEDGHPLRGFPSPPAPNLRRMFAGGRVMVLRGLRIGDRAQARTAVTQRKQKTGRSGTLTFVTTRTDVIVDDELVLVDERDIVYLPPRQNETPPAPPAPPTTESKHPLAGTGRAVQIDPTLLFRFSALTYNAHRIHYDRDYARTVERHPGLVVHGPLQALLMAEEARLLDASAGIATMDYTLVSPLYEHQGLTVVAVRTDDGADVRVHDATGRTTATARVRREIVRPVRR